MRSRWLAVLFLALYSCANQTTPTGGPKDETPPGLVQALPLDGSTNFRGKEIILVFDEPVRIENAKEQVIISPSIGKDFTLIARKNRVFLSAPNPFNDSTTYSVRFRESIKDITEGNSAVDVSLAFSTGPYLDSIYIAGTVTDLLAGLPQEDATVALFSQDTFDIFRHTPIWFSRTDDRGSFLIQNLKAGRYSLYAFEDKNKNLKIDSRGEKYGIHPSWIELTDSVAPFHIPILSLDARKLRLIANRAEEGNTLLTFNKSLHVGSLRDTKGQPIPFIYEESRSRIRAFPNVENRDSLRTTLRVVDSLNNVIDTVLYLKTRSQRALRESFKMTLRSAGLLAESATLTATLSFNKPIQSVRYDSVQYRFDSTQVFSFSPAEVSYDTQQNQILLSKKLNRNLFGAFLQNQKSRLPALFQLYFGSMAFVSVQNDSSKRLLQTVRPIHPQELATLIVHIETSSTFQVQLIQPKTRAIVQTFSNQKSVTFRNLMPDEYSIRALVYNNNTNRWDWGNPLLRIPPENVHYYVAPDGKRTVTLRANWEVGPLLLKF